jgi:cell fate regulator YaaT (PSP1 superfamily)
LKEPLKKIIRKATQKDIEIKQENEEKQVEIKEKTEEIVVKHNLDMKIVSCELSFDGSKLVINFTADDRVDFRELVKELASKLKARIELRQIGIRDKSKTVGGIGICGRECCCNLYLDDFEKVSIKMAKIQNLSLNPTKISGLCGRLMCCLEYENPYYQEVTVKMPKLNSEVNTPEGKGTVLYTNVLKQVVSVKLDRGEGSFAAKDFKLEDIKMLPKENKQPQKDNKDKQ